MSIYTLIDGTSVVQGLSPSREGGVIRRNEGGAQRLDVLVAEAGSVFRGLLSKKGIAPRYLWVSCS